MSAYVIPIIWTLYCIYWQGYCHAKYNYVKDQLYGAETLAPVMCWIWGLILYAAMYGLFKGIIA